MEASNKFKRTIRLWIPLTMVLVMAAMLIVQPNMVGVEAAAFVAGGTIAIVLVNFLVASNYSDQQIRHQEQENRDYFTKHGKWPSQKRL